MSRATGFTIEFTVYLLRPEGVLRIDHRVEPVAVDPAEKAKWRWQEPSAGSTRRGDLYAASP